MQQVFVELYKHNKKWEHATPEFRGGYVGRLLELMESTETMADMGVEIITCSFNDLTTPHRADYDFVCVYQVESEEQLRAFADIIEQSGWYEYFDQVNASGPLGGPEAVLAASRDLRTSLTA